MEKLIVASNNSGKIREIKEIFGSRFELLSLKEAGIVLDAEETGGTFLENALIKARAAFGMSKGVGVLSDDSGLCVEALSGAPGIYSARYAGKDATDKENNLLLLKNLENEKNRSAKFVSVVVLYRGENGYIFGEGETKGRILYAPEGSGGFGYDPLFFSFELSKSFGTAAAEEKNAVSHRRKALENLLAKT